MFTGLRCFMRTTSDPAESQTRASRECLAERNEVSPTIECGRHRPVCEWRPHVMMMPSPLTGTVANPVFVTLNAATRWRLGFWVALDEQLRLSFIVAPHLGTYWDSRRYRRQRRTVSTLTNRRAIYRLSFVI